MPSNPLAGFKIGVTADRRADEQIRLLSGRGADCVHGPVIKTLPIDSTDAIGEITGVLCDDPPDLIVLTTGLGVRGWLEAADSFHLGDRLQDLFVGAELYPRGAKARGALVTAGFAAATDAPLGQYSDILDALAARGVDRTRVAIQLDGAGAGPLCDAIEELGADVVRVPVYRWSLPADTGPAERLVRAVAERRVDAVTFTAKPAIENFFEIADRCGSSDEVMRAFSSGAVVPFCVGPVCATGITDVGLPEPMVPERHRLGALVQQLTHHFAAASRTFELAGVEVQAQGRLAKVVGQPDAWMTDRERSVFDILTSEPRIVHSKQSLLRSAWPGSESDEHLVEVTIARLRQRLGPASPGIETVMRRGYRASES